MGNSRKIMGNSHKNDFPARNLRKFWEKNGTCAGKSIGNPRKSIGNLGKFVGNPKSWDNHGNNHRTIEFFKDHFFGKAFLSWLYRWKRRVEQTGEFVVHHHLSGRAFTPSKSYSFASRDPEMFCPELNLAMFSFNGVYYGKVLWENTMYYHIMISNGVFKVLQWEY